MPESIRKVDEVSAALIANRKVCPYLLECEYLNYCFRPDTSSIRFAIRYCGNEYSNCQSYKSKKIESEFNICVQAGSPAQRDGPEFN
jgi:hypothetical protein